MRDLSVTAMLAANPRWQLLVLVSCALLNTLPFLGQTQHLSAREIRHAAITRTMVESSNYVVPSRLGRPYADKPPAFHGCAALAMKLSERASMFAARLPSALASVLGVIGLWALARLLGLGSAAFLAALGLVGMQGYARMARMARPDMLFCSCVLLTCLGLTALATQQRRLPKGALVVATGIAGAGALLTKGPLAFLFVGVWAVVMHGRAQRPSAKAYLLTLLATVAICLTWLTAAWHVAGTDYLRALVFQPAVTTGAAHHARPLYYYLGSIAVGALPLVFALPGSIRRWKDLGVGRLLVVVAILFVALSVIPGKRAHYLLPLYPFIALALAPWWQVNALRSRVATVLVAVAVLGSPVYHGFVVATATGTDAQLLWGQQIAELANEAAGTIAHPGLTDALVFSGLSTPVSEHLEERDWRAALAAAPAATLLCVPLDGGPAWLTTASDEVGWTPILTTDPIRKRRWQIWAREKSATPR